MKPLSRTAVLLFLALALVARLAAQDEQFQRFGLYVGANDGGAERVTLRWAVSDAQRMADVMAELGGVSKDNYVVLSNPTVGQLQLQLEHMRARIGAATVRRTEFVFYYSGHSDETGIMLGEDHYTYGELRDRIGDIGADVKIAILDSCASGAFTRLKGGAFVQPFLLDTSNEMSGHAFLTSSSESEASQESDAIGSSFFTHYLVSGLRGAADYGSDGSVTLDEVYRYARDATLSRTAGTFAGPQHPSFDFQLSGTGALKLTDLSRVDSAIVFDETVAGTLFISRTGGQLIAEVQKDQDRALTMAVPAGSYLVTLQGDDRNYENQFQIASGEHLTVASRDFRVAFRDRNRVRGDEEPVEPFVLSVLPGINIVGGDPQVTTISLGLITGNAYRVVGGMFSSVLSVAEENVVGVQLSGVGSVTGGNLTGAQNSGVFNVVNGDAVAVQNAGVFNQVNGRGALAQNAGVFNMVTGGYDGLQTAGVFNLVGAELNGLQISGVYNQAGLTNGAQISLVNISGNVTGAQVGLINIGSRVVGTQIGLINISDEMYGIPIGLANIVKHGIHDVSVWWEADDRTWLGVQNGSNIFYALLYAGIDPSGDWKSLDDLATGAGVGLRFLRRPFYIDADASIKRTSVGSTPDERFLSMFDINKGALLPTARVAVGFAIGEGLGFFVGGSFDFDLPSGINNNDYFGGLPGGIDLGKGTIYPSFFTGIKF